MADDLDLFSDPGIGHNNPPSDEAWRTSEALAALLAERAKLDLAVADLPETVTNDDDLAAITAHVVARRDLARRIEAMREEVKRPVLTAQRSIDGFFGRIRDSLTDRAKVIESAVAAYLAAKRRAEEAKRKAELDAANAKAAEAEAQERAARQAIADAQAKQDAATTDGEVREAQLSESIAQAQAGVAADQASHASKAASKATKALGKGNLERTATGAGVASLKEEPDYRIDSPTELMRSLGPLGRFLTEDAVKGALYRWCRSPTRDDVPGVSYYANTKAKVSAARARG